MNLIKPLAYLLLAVHLLTTFLQPAAFAQSISDVSNGFPSLTEVGPNDGDQFNFNIEASDNDGTVDTVIFVYKYENDIDFRELSMQPNETSTLFSVQLPDEDRQNGKLLHYYIATDNDGNISTEGFVFNPLERQIKMMTNAPDNENLEITSSNPLGDTNSVNASERKVNVLYVVLGVLAVGAVAALAGGGDDPPDDTALITVTTPLP